MAKLKTKFWFTGRSSSSPETSDNKPSIVVHLYHDLDAAVDRRLYTPDMVTMQYTAESLCAEVAKNLNISALAFHLFGLAAPNLQSWIPPNHLIPRDQKVEFVFRLRFRPHDVDVLRKCSREAFNYYFLQMRDDFLKNRIDEFMVDVSLEKLLGLALLDLLRLAKEYDHNCDWIKNQDPERFIPKSSRSSMKWIWDKKRIEYNFRQDIDPKYKKHHQQKSHSIKSWYMNALRMYAPRYGCEKFSLFMCGAVIVEPQKPQYHIYRCAEEEKGKESFHDICSIDDLMSVSLREGETSEVQLDRRDGFPQILRFEKAAEAHTFMSCLEGYYRFFVDYHYTNLCNKNIYSPILEHLASIRSHGPVDMKWARERLLSQHKANNEYNYLLLQKQDDLLSFDIIIYVENVQPVKSNVPPVAHFIINRLPSGKYQVNMHGEQMFDNMRELLQNYNIARSKHKHLMLNRCVPVKQPVDPRLYLCLNNQNDDPITPAASQSVFFQHKYPLIVPNVQTIEHNIAKGQFTDVHKASWEGEDEIITVAVKQLSANVGSALEHFTQTIHQAAFWNHGTIISIHALCLASPLQVVMELAELGDMETYLRIPKKGIGVLRVFHLVSTAEQIAQALTYLQEELANKSSGLGEVHGNIRCRNIMVCRPASESGIKVKLGDPGLIHLYNVQKIDHPLNHERLPWVAPELYNKLDKMTMFSDRYAFGITLWELFALAERPFGKMSPTEIMKNVMDNNIEKVLPKPLQCPEELYSTMRECCHHDKESRLSPKDMVKDIRSVLFKADGREYSEPSWQATDSKHYEPYGFSDSKISAEDALTDLLQQPVRPPSGTDEKFSIDMKSAPILRKHDMTPLTVNLDPKSHQVVGSPPDLREFGINDSVTGQFSNGDTGLGTPVNSSDLVNGGTDLAPSINPKGANGSNIPMDPDIQRRPLPSVPAMPLDDDRNSTIIARHRIRIHNEKPLGQGHYGKVYKGQLSLTSGEHRIIAIKSLKPKMINRFQKEFDREIKIMLKLKHENIVEIIGQCPQKSETNPLLLLMEYLENGSMDRYLRNHKEELKDEQLLRWTLEVAEGMKYLSDQKIIHRDLAARNVLIDKYSTAKISDFGLSRILDPEKDYYRSDGEKEIPVRWCAPEVLAERKFAKESDVWSYGITVWEIFSVGSPPNLCKLSDFYSELHRGKRLGRPQKCPEPAWKRVILPCWEFYPQHRPAFGKICDTIDIVINELENSLC